MEKLMLLSLPLLLLLTTGCAQDEPRVLPCGEECEIVEKLNNVTVRVVQWPFTCNFVLRTDLQTIVYSADDSLKTLLPCEGLPPEFMVKDTLVTVSGYKFNCCNGFGSDSPGCKFEITSIKASLTQFPIETPVSCDQDCQILEELTKIKARVFQWSVNCKYVLETDSALLAEGVYLDIEHFSSDILVPCEDLPSEYSSDQLLVYISGYKYDCCQELYLPTVDPGGWGCRFEITAIEPFN